MLHTSFYQISMVEVDPGYLRLAADSFERQLRVMLPRLVSPDEFRCLYAEDGAGSCCPLVLVGMMLLQFRYNLPDVEAVRKARLDLGWRYALGLVGLEEPPAVTTLRRFRAKVRRVLGDDFLHKKVLRLASAMGYIDDRALQAVDSTNSDCRGAVIDTFNLVAAGIKNVIRAVARCLGREAHSLAAEWDLEAYLARSVKGGARIDWSDEKARNALLTEEITDAKRLPELVSNLNLTLPDVVSEALALLAKVAVQDVEQLADGTYAIARGTTPGRIISITDPEARHGRKSSSKTITGFKTHVIGTIASQFVTGITITDASTHDAKPTVDLIRQTEEVELKPTEATGDAAYGTGANLRACNEEGVAILTKLPAPGHKNSISKRSFLIDLVAGTVTCPEGHVAPNVSMVNDPDGSGEQVARHRFDKATCQSCPLSASCSAVTAKGGARIITLSRYEPEHQAAIAFNNTPRAAEVLRSRSAVERLISHLVRMGMRHARFYGMQMMQFQAYMTSAAYNLQRLFTLSTRRGAKST